MSETLLLEDEFFKKLNTEEAYKLDEVQMDSFWTVVTQQVSTQVITQFGIGRLLDLAKIGDTDSYQTGGSVSTLHNADSGIFISKAHDDRYNAAYDRKKYEGRLQKADQDSRISSKRKRDFQQQEIIIDGYTGKELPKDGRAHVDHIVSAKRIHDNKKARLYMNDDERNDMAMGDKNTTYTNSSLNQSKGEHKIEDWAKKTQRKQEVNNAERFEIDPKLVKGKSKQAETFVKQTVNKAQLKELKLAGLKQGMTQMKRQLIGLILHEFSEVLLIEMRALVERWSSFKSIEDRIQYFKERMKIVKDNFLDSFRNIKDNFLGTNIEGFMSGIIGTLITTIINGFITTSQRLSRIIQDGITNIIKGFKLLVTNPDKLEKKELIETVIKLIGVGVSVSIGLILTDLIDKELSKYMPDFIANAVASVIGAVITGTMSATIIHLVDNFDHVISKVNEFWNDIKTELTISKKEIIETYNRAIAGIENEYQILLQNIALKYEELDRLSELAFDIEVMASTQFKHSIIYAEKMNVNKSNILRSEDDIANFFLN